MTFDQFLAQIKSPWWLLSVVVVGILINLVASGILASSKSLYNRRSARRLEEDSAQRARFDKLLETVRSDQHGQILLAYAQLRQFSEGSLASVIGFIFEILALYSAVNNPQLPGLIVTLGFALVGFILIKASRKVLASASLKQRVLKAIRDFDS